MAEKRAGIIIVDVNLPLDAPPVFMEGKGSGYPTVARNRIPVASQSVAICFMGTLLKTLRLSDGQVWLLVDDGYNESDTVLYWRFNDIRKWCELKDKIPESQVGLAYGYNKIKHLQSIAWRLTEIIIRGKSIDLNQFSCDILVGVIEESHTEYE